MKVICIDDSPSKFNNIKCPVSVGKIYNVINEVYGPSKILHYELEGLEIAVGVFRFIPLSDIDETEFERNYKTETINA